MTLRIQTKNYTWLIATFPDHMELVRSILQDIIAGYPRDVMEFIYLGFEMEEKK